MMNKRIDVLHGDILKTLVLLSYPILVCGFFQQLYNIVDTMIIGRFVGSDGIAIIGGSPNMLINLFNGFAVGIISGSMILVANKFGEKDEAAITKSINTSLILAVILGVVLSVSYIVLGRRILIFLNVPDLIINRSITYLAIYAVGFPFYFLFQMAINIFRAMGETKRPTMFLIASFVINIILDIFLIYFLKFNETGVALAFILTQIIGAMLVLRSLDAQPNIKISTYTLNIDILKSILVIGIPASITSILYAFTNILIQSKVNLLGSTAIAGYAINAKVENMFWIFMTCIGAAITTFVGQNYGAGYFKRINESIKKSLIIGVVITLSISALVYFLRIPLASAFSKDTILIQYAAKIMRFMAPTYITFTLIEVISGILKGMRKTIASTIITLVCVTLVRVSYILVFTDIHSSIETILKAYPLSWITASLAFILYFMYEKKKLLQLEHKKSS